MRMKKRIITIGGRPGSGKSTTSKRVAEVLEYERFSSGDFMRSIAKERGITIEELNRIAEREPALDEEVDGKLRALGNSTNFVIDSRLAFHWIPSSFKVYLHLSREESAHRIFNDQSGKRTKSSENAKTPEETLEFLEERLKSERKRYKELYDIDPYDEKNYDLTIDTGSSDIEKVIKTIVEHYNKWLKNG